MAYCIRQFAPMEMSHCTVRAFNEYENIISLLEIHCERQASSQASSQVRTVFNGVSEEHEVHRHKAWLHVVVLELLFHQFLQLRELCDVLIDLYLTTQKVTYSQIQLLRCKDIHMHTVGVTFISTLPWRIAFNKAICNQPL